MHCPPRRADRPRPRRAAGADDRRNARRAKGRARSSSASAREASPASASRSPRRTDWRSAGTPSFAACRRSRCSPRASATDGEVAAAVIGGHGELFVQQFDAGRSSRCPSFAISPPAEAARFATADAGRRIRRRAAGRGARLGRGARCLAVGRRRAAAAAGPASAAAEARLCPRSRRAGPGGGVMATPALDHDVTIAPGSRATRSMRSCA